MQKCVINPRVSSKEQEITGYSLESQEKLLNDYCERNSFEIIRTFPVSESASGRKQRKEFNMMMKYMQDHDINILVMEKVDRLTRNMKDAVMINDWLEADAGRYVHFVKDSLALHKNSPSQDRLNWNIKVVLAQNYTDNLSEEVRKGQAEKVAQGWLPTKPPLGYKTIGEKGRKIHIIDGDKGSLIIRMFEFYATGDHSVISLTKKMNELGLRNGRGNKISKSRVDKLLLDPFYIGRFLWNGKEYQGAHEPLVSNELFERVRNKKVRKIKKSYKNHEMLFRGLLTCNDCKGIIGWELQKGHTYGRCSSYRKCKKRSYYREPDFERLIIDSLDQFQLNNNRLCEWVRAYIKNDHNEQIRQRKLMLSEMDSLEKKADIRLDRLYMDKLDGTIDGNTYIRLREQFSQEKKEIIHKRKRYGETNSEYQELGVLLYDLSQKAGMLYEKAEIGQKRKIMGLLFKKMHIVDGRLDLELTEPFQLLYASISKTNAIGSEMQNSGQSRKTISEPVQNVDNKGQNTPFEVLYPTLLSAWDTTRTTDWNSVVEYPKHTQELLREILFIPRYPLAPAA